jgi:hypothetical protein
MLAARDQENLVHGRQTAAAGKSLNQASKPLPPRTPFKKQLNDENGPAFGAGKPAVKLNGNANGNGSLMTGGKNGAFLEKSAFITPIGKLGFFPTRR